MRTLLVGYGYWGKIIENYIIKNKDFELIDIYYRTKYKNQSLEEILDKEKIEAVFICTPIETHYGICKICIKRKIHVFCEKPLCKSSAENIKLYNLTKEYNVVLYTDYIYCISSSINYIKNKIDKIGALNNIRFQLSQFGNFYQNDDVWDVLGVHYFSILFYLFPSLTVSNIEIKILHKNNTCHNKDESSFVIFETTNNTLIEIYVSIVSADKQRKIEISGDKGSILFDMLSKNSIIHLTYNEKNIALTNKEKYSFDENNNLVKALSDFSSCILNKDYKNNQRISTQTTKLLEKIHSYDN